jgi:ADP-ribose pyrophosphatase YjhB (NUDIX family)
MLVWRDDKLLLIERMKYPFGFAPPAGHVDEDKTFEAAAIRELREEVGLKSDNLELLTEGRKENKCRREGGDWHYWKIYKIEADGDVSASRDETKQFGWFSKDELKELAKRGKSYQAGEITDEEWVKNPGLELVWLEWLSKLEII